MRKTGIFQLVLALLTLLLPGCGTYYNVTVDSLRADEADPAGTYCLTPGNETIREDDLLFRDVAGRLEPAFVHRGFRVVDDCAQAQNIAAISYQLNEPDVRVSTGTRFVSKPVVLWDGRKNHVEYVSVEEPTVTTTTTYSASIIVEAYRLDRGGKSREGQPLWRTEATCASGSISDFRNLLAGMVPVLSESLGGRTQGAEGYEVYIEDNGKVSVSPMN